MDARVTVLYDNERMRDDLESGWGFSCLVERDGERLLFDTCWDGDQLVHNAGVLGIDLATVPKVFISHDHWDHIGGLARVLREMDRPDVYLLGTVSAKLRGEVAERATVIDVSEETEVAPGLYSTGPMGTVQKEQSLLMELEDDELFVITGCAHQGLDSIMEFARARGSIRGILGGFHGFDRIDDLARVRDLYPCHCTVYKKDIKDRFPDRTRIGGAGLVLDL